MNSKGVYRMDVKFRLSYQVNTVSWDGTRISKLSDAEITRAFDLFQNCGIDMVMISGYHVEEPSSFDMDMETKRIGAELAARGMRAAQHHGLSATYAPIGSSQQEAVDHMCACIDYTANLGAESLVLHSGRATGHFTEVNQSLDIFKMECGKHGIDRVLECCAANLHAAGKYAEERGVLIAFENLDRFEPLGNMTDLPKLVAMADSPAVGFCLDSGHAHCAGSDVVKWIEIMGDKLFTTHFHDNHGPSEKVLKSTGFVSPHGIDEHLPPGFGTISWTDVIEGLLRTGYKHPVNFESGAWPGMEPSEGLKSAINYWRTCEYLVGKKISKVR